MALKKNWKKQNEEGLESNHVCNLNLQIEMAFHMHAHAPALKTIPISNLSIIGKRHSIINSDTPLLDTVLRRQVLRRQVLGRPFFLTYMEACILYLPSQIYKGAEYTMTIG